MPETTHASHSTALTSVKFAAKHSLKYAFAFNVVISPHVGAADGKTVGSRLGKLVGCVFGGGLGFALGATEGRLIGASLGLELGGRDG
jgi:hypothetical protein